MATRAGASPGLGAAPLRVQLLLGLAAVAALLLALLAPPSRAAVPDASPSPGEQQRVGRGRATLGVFDVLAQPALDAKSGPVSLALDSAAPRSSKLHGATRVARTPAGGPVMSLPPAMPVAVSPAAPASASAAASASASAAASASASASASEPAAASSAPAPAPAAAAGLGGSGLLVRLVSAGRLLAPAADAGTASLPTYELAGGAPARFVLDVAVAGRPPPTGQSPGEFDLWRADVSGRRPSSGRELVASVPVVIARNAWGPAGVAAASPDVYSFELALPPDAGGTYRLEVHLQQQAFHEATFQSDACAVTRDPLSLQATVMLVVAAEPAPAAAAGPAGGGGLFRGWYEGNLTADEPSYMWHSAPAAPTLRYFTPTEARSCLADKWLAFVGDSTMEEVAISTVLLTGTPFEEDWASADLASASCRSLGFRPTRMFDTDAVASALAAVGARVTMHWAAATDVCRDLGGAKTFEDPDFVARFLAAHTPDRAGGRTPHVVFNTGLHDLGRVSPRFTLDDFRRQMRTAVLPALASVRAAMRIFKTSNPKSGEYACRGHGVQVNVGEAAVQALNRESLQLLAEARGGAALGDPPPSPEAWRLLDEHALLLPLHDESQVHQHHCSDVLIRPPRSLERVHAGCLASAHALLSMLCPG